jgi:thiol:disulfide interchange protein
MGVEVQRAAPRGPSGRLPVIAGIVLGLLGIGLPMIGVTINLLFGFVILTIAFALIALGCWIWEGKSPRRKALRIITICIIAVIYFSLVVMQICAQYKKDHYKAPPVAPSQPSHQDVVIKQNATDSDCSNLVTESNAQIDCEAERKRHAKDKVTR